MGLDMNMYATQNSEANEQNLFEEDYFTDLKSWYWRKANQIHNWMVNNVQDGNDDCGLYEVSIDHILELHKEESAKLIQVSHKNQVQQSLPMFLQISPRRSPND